MEIMGPDASDYAKSAARVFYFQVPTIKDRVRQSTLLLQLHGAPTGSEYLSN
jgi:hypothetical protein